MASQDHGIHSFKECGLEGSDYVQQTLGRAHTRRSWTHNKRKLLSTQMALLRPSANTSYVGTQKDTYGLKVA